MATNPNCGHCGTEYVFFPPNGLCLRCNHSIIPPPRADGGSSLHETVSNAAGQSNASDKHVLRSQNAQSEAPLTSEPSPTQPMLELHSPNTAQPRNSGPVQSASTMTGQPPLTTAIESQSATAVPQHPNLDDESHESRDNAPQARILSSIDFDGCRFLGPDGLWYLMERDTNQNARNDTRGYAFMGPFDASMAIEVPRDSDWYADVPAQHLRDQSDRSS